MKNVTKTIDVNAHIANINSQITIENGISKAVISFSNLGYGIITAVKFKAKGYNTFNDIIQIDGNDNFIVIIQDVHIEKNAEASNLTVKMPNNDIRKLELEEYQICWESGDVTTYKGKNEVDFELQELDYSGSERTEILALRDVFEPKSTYVPLDTEYGWICTCGRLNYPENTMCSLCHHTKSEVEHNLSDDGRKEIKETRDKLNIKKMEESDRKDRRKKKTKIIIGSVFFLVFALVITIISITSYNKEMVSREIFSSEYEMQAAVQGKWTYYENDTDYYGKIQLVIKGEKGYMLYFLDGDLGNGTNIDWNPSKGTFNIGNNEYVVKKDTKSIKCGKKLYKKGGILASNSNDNGYDYDTTSHYTYETVYSALDFSYISVYTNSAGTYCKGTVTNNGKKTYKYVYVKGSFKDNSGKIIDVGSTYAIGREGLSPGESKSFKIYTGKHSGYMTCDISIISYQ